MKLKSCFSAAPLAVAAFLAMTLFSGHGIAQDEFSESHMAAAKEVVLSTKGLENFDNILPILAEQTRTLFIQSDPARTQEIDEVTTEIAISMAPQRSDLNRTVYEIWARRFSEEELKQLADFYKSPLGKKLADNGPTITALAIGAARQWQDKLATEMVSLVREELDKRTEAAQ